MYSMVVATKASGWAINAHCKDDETLDAAFAHLAATHGIESWDGWMLSAWPREQRQRIIIVDGKYVEDGPYIKQDCHDCGDSTHIASPWSSCADCHKEGYTQ